MAIAVRPGAVRRSRALAIAFAAVIVCGACGDPEASAQITGFRQGARQRTSAANFVPEYA